MNLPLSINPEELLASLNNIKDILKREPATPELAALEHLTVVKDADIKGKLDEFLIKEIKDKSDQIAISYPYEIIDEFGNASAFKITGKQGGGKRDFLPVSSADSMPSATGKSDGVCSGASSICEAKISANRPPAPNSSA